MSQQIEAIEFFSGIGAFAEAARSFPVKIQAAFDQNELANIVYKSNFGLCPQRINLEAIKTHQVGDASIWWMSPPCTPFSRRGKQRDYDDPRARALLRLIDLIPEKRPSIILLENVAGFSNSRVKERLLNVLDNAGYETKAYDLCSSMFGVPMLRPRHFVVALHGSPTMLKDLTRPPAVDVFRDERKLCDYLICSADVDDDLILSESELTKYWAVLNIVDPSDGALPVSKRLICFTRNYFKCRKASGSLIRMPDSRVRFVSPEEIIDLLGFSDSFRFPDDLDLSTRLRLAGNSVDVRAIKAILLPLLGHWK